MMSQIYGGRFINDLGSYQGCKQFYPQAEFAVANFNLSRLPVVVAFGICMPAECKQADYDQVTDKLN